MASHESTSNPIFTGIPSGGGGGPPLQPDPSVEHHRKEMTVLATVPSPLLDVASTSSTVTATTPVVRPHVSLPPTRPPPPDCCWPSKPAGSTTVAPEDVASALSDRLAAAPLQIVTPTLPAWLLLW